MTALSANRQTEKLDVPREFRTYDVAASTTIYAGGLVAINASGYLVPASASTSLEVVGIADEAADNSSGANGDLAVIVDRCIAKLANSTSTDEITIAEVGDDCYAVDDQTVAKTDGGVQQVTTGTVVANNGDTVGVDVDSLPRISVTSTADATATATLLANAWNASAEHFAAALATTDTADVTWSFKDKAAHTVTAYSPATADVTPIATDPTGVAATRVKAGRVHKVESDGVYVDTRH